MNVHKKKGADLNDGQKDGILSRYLTMKNKLSFQYFNDELKGLEQERDDAALVL
jgi:hypothetical protein